MKKLLIVLPLLAIILFTTGFSTCAKSEEPKKTTISDDTSGIKWLTFEQAIEAQKKNPKKILMDAYTDWCGPCKMLDAQTFRNPDVVKYVNENFYAVKFDAEGNESINFKGKTYKNPNYDPAKDKSRNSAHELAIHFRVQAYPTVIFLDEEANVITPLRGFMNAQQLELFLKLFASNDYKNVKTETDWANYQKNFKSTFK